MVLLAGVEEAGRGPVIGPMVMAGVTIDEKDEHKLASLGAKDSKLLTPLKREQLFDQILNMVKGYEIVILPPKEIDSALESATLNLNWLEAITSAKITDKLKPDKVILDCPSTNIKAYSDYFKKSLKNQDITIVAEHKADVNHPVVGAASIIAKVTRDREIEKIKHKIGENFGSGYPSDPTTKAFIEKNWAKYPEIFRKTWNTYKKIADKKKQKGLGDF